MMSSADIRRAFLDFFRDKEHEIIPSAPIVVKNDPTLMFTNAGMNQFKDYFLGNKKPPYLRVADTQKCLRVSGKHNDLEEVGVDIYHHTMFEMLGNWSFGNYFKKEAIAWSWELLTGVYKIDPNRLYVTVFEGDKKEGLPRDEEALAEWKKWIPEDKILYGNKKDNFWEMGDTGPCGPCTEIHYDAREEANNDGHALVNNDDTGRVVEIWNNVFIQYNRLKNGSLEPLPAKHVDTGMGLERLARVLQKKASNYDTDIFKPFINEIENITGIRYGKNEKIDIAMRVIADHIRAISFTICDGQLPSNTGAGYVIRRILRRAVRYYYTYLNHKEPLLHRLVPTLVTEMGDYFTELKANKTFIGTAIFEEERSFLQTLERGIERFNKYLDEVINTNRIEQVQQELKKGQDATSINIADKKISGSFAFELYDTYGFPLDLTVLMAREIGLMVDEKGFEEEMNQQKSRSRAATNMETEDWIELKKGSTLFVGYDVLEANAEVLKYRKVRSKGKEFYQVVLDVTPFYAESGGQVGDTGQLTIGNKEVKVWDTKKENELIVHYTDSIPADLNVSVFAKVDAEKRKDIALHHSATHLLHAALRKLLGTHVLQKGSLVNAEHLRFDFSHFAKTSDEEISAIESLVNEKIRANIPVVIKEMTKEESMKMGAMALFGEKYGDRVRVVIIDPSYSVELCGGTHVGSTGELGFFKIANESAIAAGVRRIEAITGKQAENFIKNALGEIRSIREHLRNPADIRKSIEQLQQENAELKKHLDALEARQLVVIRNELLRKDEIIDGVNFIGDIIEVSNPEALKKLCFDLKHHVRDHLAVLAVNIGGKPYVAVGISDTVVAAKNLDAGKIIKEHVAPLIKGGGGGQKNLATAGGQDISNLPQVIARVKSLLNSGS